MKTYDNVVEQLGGEASFYLEHASENITKDELQVPDENFYLQSFCQK